MNFYEFLRNESPDFKGRFLSDIWNFNDNQIENKHDFIQMIFPLNKPSEAVFHGLYLDNEIEINKMKKDKLISKNLIFSKDWFVKFLERNDGWMSYSDHNQLRITRIIECLRLLVSNYEADLFYSHILKLLGTENNVNKSTLHFWSKA